MSKDIFSLLKAKPSQSAASVTKPASSKVKVANVAALLTETIQKHPFPLRWEIVGTHLIRNTYRITEGEVKVAAFDLDSTLINTKSGLKFARSPNDWKWWTTPQGDGDVVAKIEQLVEQKYVIVVFTNQGAVIAQRTSKSYLNFVNRVNLIVAKLPGKVLVFASPKRPAKGPSSTEQQHNSMRKPSPGMWLELVLYLELQKCTVDTENSFFVGDAAGRPQDFLDSDKLFAQAVGILFKVPEDFFVPTKTEEKS